MLKKLGIVAACGLALYGLTRLINRHVIVEVQAPGRASNPFAASPDFVEGTKTMDKAPQSATQGEAPIPVGANGAGVEEACAAGEQAQRPDGAA